MGFSDFPSQNSCFYLFLFSFLSHSILGGHKTYTFPWIDFSSVMSCVCGKGGIHSNARIAREYHAAPLRPNKKVVQRDGLRFHGRIAISVCLWPRDSTFDAPSLAHTHAHTPTLHKSIDVRCTCSMPNAICL